MARGCVVEGLEEEVPVECEVEEMEEVVMKRKWRRSAFESDATLLGVP